MTLTERAALAAMHLMDPERAHGLAIRALQMGLTPKPGVPTSDRLATRLAGLDLANPIGLAAGFDKNAQAISPLLKCGFGFVEVGAATPRPQAGNPKPRLFRLTEDKAAINRFGFNNDGATAIGARLARRPDTGVVGLNLGANKDSVDRAADFAEVLRVCGAHLDFATVNVSSPNTEKLRDLQGAAALEALLGGVIDTRNTLHRPVPIFLKIAPDLSGPEIADIAAVARGVGVDAVIATNTTLSRDGLKSPNGPQAGGLSGQPLFDRSTRVLRDLYGHLQGDVPLIGVGGIATAQQALAKIQAGAAAVQLYTALIWGGITLPARLAEDLDTLLAEKGFSNVSEAVGSE